MTAEQMIEELTQLYEAAGFADFYEREPKGKNDDEIAKMYRSTASSTAARTSSSRIGIRFRHVAQILGVGACDG